MSKWTKISDIVPISGRKVLVCFTDKHNKHYRTIATYIAPKTVLAEDFLNEDYDNGFSEYDEEKDCYWSPGGFYEYQYESDVNFYISGTVTHWMPLPDKPEDEE